MTIAAVVTTPPTVQLKTKECPEDLSPVCDKVRKFIRDGGLNPDEIEVEHEDYVVWKFPASPGFSIVISISRAKDGEMFLYLSVAVARMDKSRELEISRWLLQKAATFIFPLRIALSPEGLILLEFQSYVAGVTENQIDTRLNTLWPISKSLFDDLHNNFELRALLKAGL